MTDLMWAAQLVEPRQPLKVSRIAVPRPRLGASWPFPSSL